MNENKENLLNVCPDVEEHPSDSEPFQVSLDAVLRIACGIDELNNPKAVASLAKDRITGEEPQIDTTDNLYLEQAVYQIFTSGGCAVIEAIFPISCKIFYEQAYKMCKDWLHHTSSEEVLTLLISPYLLNGCIHVLFQGLTYAYGTEQQDGFRLILGFDHNATIPYETEDIDYAEIYRLVEAEIIQEEKELYEDLDAAIHEVDELKKEQGNPFKDGIKNEYDPGNIKDHRSITVEKRGIRSGKNYQGIRIAKEDDNDET